MEKIDIHNRVRGYASSKKHLEKMDTVTKGDKKLIFDFLEDCENGKTVKNRAKKKISVGRCTRLLDIMKFFGGHFPKPVQQMKQDELEKFVFAFEKNKYKNKKDKGFKPSTIVYYKKGLKKFYQWLKEKHDYGLDFSFMETYDAPTEVPALTRQEVDKMAALQDTLRNKALIFVFFDSGCRTEELLNVRLQDITDEETLKIRIKHGTSKTTGRTISLPLSSNMVRDYLASIDKSNPEQPLFDLSYDATRMVIKRAGKNAVGKLVTPLVLRHTSATYYCNLLNRHQLCYRMGWAMSSKMPDRYIDRSGIIEDATIKTVKHDEVSKVQSENKKLKEDMDLMKAEMNRYNSKFNEFLKEFISSENKDKAISAAKNAGIV